MNENIPLSLTEEIEKESKLIEEKLRHASNHGGIKTEDEIEATFMAEVNKFETQNDLSPISEDDPDFALSDIKSTLFMPDSDSEKEKSTVKNKVYQASSRTNASMHTSPRNKPKSKANRLGQFFKQLVS